MSRAQEVLYSKERNEIRNSNSILPDPERLSAVTCRHRHMEPAALSILKPVVESSGQP